jgi:hypothetical protein
MVGFNGGTAGVGQDRVGERANRWGPCISEGGGEREDVEDRRRESNKKTYSAEYAKGMSRPSGPTNGTGIHRKNRFLNFKDF